MADETKQIYDSREWHTGDVITADALNKIENEMEYVSAEVTNAVTGTVNDQKLNDTIARKLDSIVKYFPEEPTEENLEYVRMYVQPAEDNGEIEVPTYEEFTDLNNAFIGLNKTNLSYHFPYFIGFNAPYNWGTASNVYSYIFPVHANDHIQFIAGGPAAGRYTFLKSLNGINNNSVPDFASGYNASIAVAVNSRVEIIAPEDAQYFYMIAYDGSNSRAPSELYINGQNILVGTLQNISDISKNVENLNIEISNISSNTAITQYVVRLDNASWSNNGGNTYNYLIPVKAQDIIYIKAGVRTCYYTVLKSKNNMYSFGLADFATGYNALKGLAATTDLTFIIPDDAKYLYIFGFDGTNSFLPEILEINKYNMYKDLRTNLYNKTKYLSDNNITNWYNKTQLTEGMFINYQNGEPISNQYSANYAITDYIPVNYGDIVHLAYVQGTNLCGGALYDANKTFIKPIWGTENFERPASDLNKDFQFVIQDRKIAYFRYIVSAESVYKRELQYIWVTPNKIFSTLNKTFYVGPNEFFTTLKDITEYIDNNKIENATVYVKPGTYDLVNEYGQSYLDELNVSNNAYVGLHVGYNTTYIFDEGAYVKFLYNGNNLAITEYFSAFNVIGSCTLQNANIEVTNARYCVHQDLLAGHIIVNEYTVKYINCIMKHNGNTVGTYTGTICIGAGTAPNSVSIIEGGQYTCGTQFPWAISYHNYDMAAYENNLPSKVIVKNVWTNNGIRLGQFADSIISVEISGCKLPSGMYPYDPLYFKVTEWNNMYNTATSTSYWTNVLINSTTERYTYDNVQGNNTLYINVNPGDTIDINKISTTNAYYSFVNDQQIVVGNIAGIVNSKKNIVLPHSIRLIVPDGCTQVLIYDPAKVIKKIILNETYDLFTNTKINKQLKAQGDLFTITATDDIISKNYSPKVQKSGITKRVIAVNHDDLAEEDWANVRTVYNKYGFKVNFSLLVQPFTSIDEMNKKVKAMKEMIEDGHQIGLHGFFGTSFWWMNKLWDITPGVGHTFAPSLNELQNSYDSDKFSRRYTASTTLERLGYVNSGYSGTIGEISIEDFTVLSAKYALAYGANTYTGLDLTGTQQTWTYLHWLEYWYNELIDDSLGYSNNSAWIDNFFWENYEVPSGTQKTGAAYKAYYPTASNLLSGKIVFFDDTSNPHYSDASYQKVGRFKKGLFKGHASCCNYQVEDICIKIAKAFCNYYFGFDTLTTYDRHGIKYVELRFVSDDKIGLYDDRTLKCVAGEFGQIYDTKLGIFETQQDILLRNGITCSTHFTPIESFIEGQVGIYYGMQGTRYPYYWTAAGFGNSIQYLDLIGSENNYKNESYTMNQVLAYFKDQKDWIKYAYEKAGEVISDGTNTAYMHNFFQRVIDTINSTKGTNMIPCLSLDTIVLNASNNAAVELLCQYCVKNGYEIVPLETARKLATSFAPDFQHNYFPNPAFNQSLLVDFGGTSTSPHAYVPDGYQINYDPGVTQSNFIINVNENRKMTITNSSGSNILLESHMYSILPGEYSISIKGTGFVVEIYALKNKDCFTYYPTHTTTKQITPIWSKTFTATEETATGTFIIPEHTYKSYNVENYRDAITKGYGDNVSDLMILITSINGTTGTISQPIIKLM